MNRIEYPLPSIAQAHAAMASGATSAVELTERCLTNIDRSNEALHAFVSVAAREALLQAQESDLRFASGEPRPLEGIPIAVKDTIDVAGLATRAQSLDTSAAPRPRDADAVRRLRDAGAVILGKTATWEYAIGESGGESPWPAARNPRELSRDPGGSSSGSAAAVAAGLCIAALGTDTGGSVRAPAAWCGVVGFKPTHGRIAMHGVVPLSTSMDHAGWITRNCADAQRLLSALDDASPPRGTHATAAPSPLPHAAVLGVWRNAYLRDSPADPEVHTAFEASLERLARVGVELRDIALPALHAYDAACTVISRSEAHAANLGWLSDPARRALVGRAARERLLAGGLFDEADAANAHRLRTRLRETTLHAMKGIDAIVLPTMPTCALPASAAAGVMRPEVPLYVRFASCLGWPSLTVPCVATGALPAGFMLTGRPGADEHLLALGDLFESARDDLDAAHTVRQSEERQPC